MRSRRFSFLAGWMAVAVLAVAGFAAFGTSGPTGDQVRQEAAEASLGHAAGAYAGLGFVQLGPAGSSLATTSLRAGTAEANPTGDDETQGTAGASSSKAAGTIAAPGTGWLSEVEVRALVSLYFKPADVNRAVRVAWCESRFDPKATDHRTGGGLKVTRHQVGHPVVELEPAFDDEGGALANHHTVGVPHLGQHHHVEQPGLVLQVEEPHSPGRCRPLTMGDHTRPL
jgi:hypothetical protein